MSSKNTSKYFFPPCHFSIVGVKKKQISAVFSKIKPQREKKGKKVVQHTFSTDSTKSYERELGQHLITAP